MSAKDDSEITNTTQFGVEVSAHSHLVFSKLRKYNEVVFWERPELPDVPTSDLDVLRSLRITDRVDNLSRSLYGDPVLWWIFSIANNIGLPPLKMNPGFVVRLTDGGTIKDLLRSSLKT